LFSLLALFVLGLVFNNFFVKTLTDWMWLRNIGFSSILYRLILLKCAAFLLPFAFSLLLFYFWFVLIRQAHKNWLLFLLAWLISIAFGINGLLNWKLLLLYPFGIFSGYKDPVFHIDAYFYQSALPLLQNLFGMLALFFLLLLILDAVLFHKDKKMFQNGKLKLAFSQIVFLILSFIHFFLFFLSNAMEMFVRQPHARLGVDFSAFYGNFVGSLIWIALLLLFFTVLLFHSFEGLPIGKVFLYASFLVFFYFILQFAYPPLLNNFYVKPNELMVQKKFSKYRIESTRNAFGLGFTPAYYQNYDNLENALESGFNSLRLWDTDPYLKVINQIQSIKTYFDFVDADVDVYRVTNGKALNQVVLSARELNVLSLPSDSLNWDNLHLRYTHGYGAVLSPSHQADREGGPLFWLYDLEEKSAYSNFSITQPQIYFGELTSNYIIVRTSAEEFEYTSATNRITTSYRLEKGIKLNGFFQKLLFTLLMKEKNILFSRYLTKDSRIIYRRQILERVRSIFPYFIYDTDPYPVILNGKIFWLIDAYTASERFPLAEKYDTPYGKWNFIRNSVKVSVDAYSGDVEYYLIDPEDPIARSYEILFPKLFRKKIPSDLKEHFRYPYVLLKIQSEVLCKYHVENADSFYNSEDVWEIPKQIYGEKTTNFEPYYVLQSFSVLESNSAKPQFCVTEPFSPRGRENLAGWVSGYYDEGLKLALHYPENPSTALGPMQVEAKINQDETMSSLFTLWGQKGAKTFRGNVKFFPIGDKILYLEPIFLESTAMGIPQLAKIAAIYQGKVYLGNQYEDIQKQIVQNGK
jgi:uncharacterized membrane protein (UPF0182 family)